MSDLNAAPHFPVMLPQVLEALAPQAGEIHVDGTFGAGGYTKALLDDGSDIAVVSIDRDPSVLAQVESLKKTYGERLTFCRGCFGDVADLLSDAGIGQVDGFVLDIGVSSMQIDEAERGFSFRFDGPLDMRMDTQSDLPTAADLVNTLPEAELARIFYEYGEERKSRAIARKIVAVRGDAPFETTLQLADLVRSVIRGGKQKIDPATRVFQALRIAVNEELAQLEAALKAALSILKTGGRLVVVTFHSLEDRIVKNFMREHAGLNDQGGSRYVPDVTQDKAPVYFSQISKKAVLPDEDELAVNGRSRSAKLRWAIRSDVPYEVGGAI